MRTLVVAGDGALPSALREVIERGSTVVEQRHVRDVADALPAGIDRVVFWAAGKDPAIVRLANASARREASAGREAIVFVAGSAAAAERVQISPAELYAWPRDEDRLKMAFLTGG